MLRIHSKSANASRVAAASTRKHPSRHGNWSLASLFADGSDRYGEPPPGAAAHDPGREGVRLGLVLAVTIWLWIALVDLAVGAPLRTFALIGGVVPFTIAHTLLCVLYGIALVTVVSASRDEPTLIAGVVFGSLLLEIAFVMVTVVLASLGLGMRAWLQILGGSLIGGGVTLAFLFRRYPLRAIMQRAHEGDGPG